MTDRTEEETETGTAETTETLSLEDATGPVGRFEAATSEEEAEEERDTEEGSESGETFDDDSSWEPVKSKRERFKPRKRKLNLTEKNAKQAEALEAYRKLKRMKADEDSVRVSESERRRDASKAIETQEDLANTLNLESEEGYEEVQVLVIEQVNHRTKDKRLVYADTGKEVPDSRKTMSKAEANADRTGALFSPEVMKPKGLPASELATRRRQVMELVTQIDSPEGRASFSGKDNKGRRDDLFTEAKEIGAAVRGSIDIDDAPGRGLGKLATWGEDVQQKLDQAIKRAEIRESPISGSSATKAAEGIEALTGTEDLTNMAIASHMGAIMTHAKERGINLPKGDPNAGNRPLHNWAHLAKALFASIERPDSKASDDALDVLDHAMNVPEEELRAAAGDVARELHAVGIPLTPCPIGDVPATIKWSQQAAGALDEAAKAAAE